MSEQDVELARRTFGTLADEGYEALLPQIHPDFEMETLPGIAAEPQVYRGPDGVRRWWESFYEVMDEVRIEPKTYWDAGPGRVLMEARLSARGQSSGLDLGQDTWFLCHLRDERLIRIEFFASRDEAMAAIG